MVNSEVADFYAHKSVLVTGATGFLGKVLIEKLLRSVPDLKYIYAFVRPSKGQSSSDRWRKTTESDLFDLIRKNPDNGKSIFEKVVVVDSDMMEDDLGLSVSDVKRLLDDVSVIFHCAATVKFDEHMRIAVKMNMIGTLKLVKLAHEMKRLESFVHCSTAFCNCNRTYVMERVYPATVDPRKLIDALDWMNDEMLDGLTPALIGRRPNTYTLTKALTESLLVEESNHLPITIVRPSIVTAAWREPKPGWIDNYNGATGLMALTIKGLIRVLYGRLHEIKADIVPVDLAVNMLIVAGWHRAMNKTDPMPVIHVSTDRLNPVTWGAIIEHLELTFKYQYPLSQLYREPGGNTTILRSEYRIKIFVDHVIPAYIIDCILFVLGKRRMMLRLYDKIFKALDTLEYFYSNNWEHQSRMAPYMVKQLSEEDRRRFYIDVREIDWRPYVRDYGVGIRKYILKEDISTAKEGFVVRSRRRFITKAFNIGLWAFVLRFFVRKTKFGTKTWATLMAMMNGTKRKIIG